MAKIGNQTNFWLALLQSPRLTVGRLISLSVFSMLSYVLYTYILSDREKHTAYKCPQSLESQSLLKCLKQMTIVLVKWLLLKQLWKRPGRQQISDTCRTPLPVGWVAQCCARSVTLVQHISKCPCPTEPPSQPSTSYLLSWDVILVSSDSLCSSQGGSQKWDVIQTWLQGNGSTFLFSLNLKFLSFSYHHRAEPKTLYHFLSQSW